jgi:Flp pilus assembly pilin Flp
MRTLLAFLKDESGLVTVEWVAIAAAVVVGGIAIAWAVLDQLDPVAATIGTTLSGVPGELGDPPAFGDGATGPAEDPAP